MTGSALKTYMSGDPFHSQRMVLCLCSAVLLLLLRESSSTHSAGAAVGVPAEGICSLSVLPHGYKCDEFEVKTDDGYILSVQRIQSLSVGSGGNGRRQPVLLQHGVLVDGMTWFMNSRDENLPFILSDQGFDVWIANTRGTRFCRRHQTLDSTQPEFWNWSWEELAAVDLPAVVEFVSRQTGKKINYVGHSMGTLILMVSLSERRLSGQLNSAALLSPVAYLSHMTTVLGVVAARSFVGEFVKDVLRMTEFNPKGQAVGQYLDRICQKRRFNCYDLLTSFTGKNCCLNASTVALFLKSEPQSTSTKTMVHLSQIVRHGVVARYNYGSPVLNIMRYGEAQPPVYDLSNIPTDFPLFISYGGRDSLADMRDVEVLLNVLKLHEQDKLTVQFIEDYAHADFIIGITAKDNVYRDLLSFFDRHSLT